MTTVDNDNPSGIGGRVGARMASLVADATVATRQKMGPHTAGVANQVLTDFTNHVSDEIRSAVGPLWAKFAQAPETPEELRPLFHNLANERGQAWAWIGGLVSSTGIAGGLSGVFQALLNPLVYDTNAIARTAILNPSDAARAQVIGRSGVLNIEHELASAGYSDERQSVLLALAHNVPPPDVALDLWRRGIIPRVDAADILQRNGLGGPDIERMLALRETPLSPPDAAAAWARSELTEAQTDAAGAKYGVSAEDMRILRALAGQPPSPEELLFAWRRGIISESDVDRGLIEGPIRNEWLSVIKNLQWLPLPAQEAANAVNQGHLDLATAQQVAKENGVKPEDFKVIVDNAGIPPGPQEALDWVNAGYISEQDFRTIFAESRIKNKYIDLYLKARAYILPPDTIRLLFSRGAFTREQAIAKLLQRGLSTQDATAYVEGASAEKTQKSRDLTVSQTLELRADGLITNDDALAMLQAAGYDPDEALWVTELADLRRVARFVTAAVNRTKASYIAGQLDEIRAGAVLDSLNLPAQYKEQAFQLWDLERTTVTKGLTTAQVVAAVKAQLITPEQGVARLIGQGYAQEDATILLVLGKAISRPA